jgi:hypothetical protein
LNSKNAVGLSWQTTQEESTSSFDIQRSPDGINWNSIGSVLAQGNSGFVTNYSFHDLFPIGLVDYYRLKSINQDGTFSYSDVEIISISPSASFRIFPNPAKDYLNIVLGCVSNKSVIRLFNLRGQTVFTQQPNSESGSTFSIPVQNLTQGIYMLQVLDSDGSRYTGKVMIVR